MALPLELVVAPPLPPVLAERSAEREVVPDGAAAPVPTRTTSLTGSFVTVCDRTLLDSTTPLTVTV